MSDNLLDVPLCHAMSEIGHRDKEAAVTLAALHT